MFKIPTYEELEKKESQLNNDRLAYSGTHLLKRKKNQEYDTSDLGSSHSPATKQKTPSPTALSKIKSKTPEPLEKQEIPSQSAPQNQINVRRIDEDDDDDLLNMFIEENKDIIEKPLSQPKPATKPNDISVPVNKPNEFAVPEIPAPIKFDPKMPILRAEFQTSTSNKNVAGSSYGGGPLIVSSKQRGNPVLKHIKNVPWKFCDQITPDYQMSRLMCGFFLSMKYHLLNATYIHNRLKEIGRAYNIRVILALVDVKEPRHCIKELEKLSIVSNISLLLCWSNEEVARYLETFKAYEFKSAEAIMEKATVTAPSAQGTANFNVSDANFVNSITDFLCQIKSINKTDASTLRQTFGSIKQLSMSSKEELNLCPGLGPLKVNRLHEIFRIPFLINKK